MSAALAGEAVFVPGDPGRLGSFAVYHLTDERPSTTVALALPTAKSVRRRAVAARLVPLGEAIPALLTLDRSSATPSLAAWSVAVTATVGLIARGRLLPAASAGGHNEWRVVPLDPAAAAFPPGKRMRSPCPVRR